MRASPLCSSTRQGRAGRRGCAPEACGTRVEVVGIHGLLLKPAPRRGEPSGRRPATGPQAACAPLSPRPAAVRHSASLSPRPFPPAVKGLGQNVGRGDPAARRRPWEQPPRLGCLSLPAGAAPILRAEEGWGSGGAGPAVEGIGVRDLSAHRRAAPAPLGPAPHILPPCQRERERHEQHVAGWAEVHAAWAECWWGVGCIDIQCLWRGSCLTTTVSFMTLPLPLGGLRWGQDLGAWLGGEKVLNPESLRYGRRF